MSLLALLVDLAVIAVCGYFCVIKRTGFLAYVSLPILLALALLFFEAGLRLANPSYTLAVLFGVFYTSLSIVYASTIGYGYLTLFVGMPSLVIGIISPFLFKLKLGSLSALISVGVTLACLLGGFSLLMSADVDRALREIDGKVTCAGKRPAAEILLGSKSKPHAWAKTDQEGYIYSFKERKFVPIETQHVPYWIGRCDKRV